MIYSTILHNLQHKMRTHREGFSLITAIFVIILMATVTSLILNTTGKVIKETTMQYRNEQARLLAKSYTELALLSVMGHDRATLGNCVTRVQGTINTLQIGQANPAGGNVDNGGYTVTTDIQYIANGFPASGTCTILNAQDLTSLQGPNMIIDVYVRYQDPDQPTAAHQITYHRRTLQKL